MDGNLKVVFMHTAISSIDHHNPAAEKSKYDPFKSISCIACESYHGCPTLEADAGLNVVVASWTFLCGVEFQH